MELFRSREMKYVSITMTNESAHTTLKAIGAFGRLHVIDLTVKEGLAHTHEASLAYKQQNNYKKRVNDIIFWERKLLSLFEECKRRHIAIPDLDSCPPRELTSEERRADVLEGLSSWIDALENDLSVSMTFQKENERMINELKQRKQVLIVAQRMEKVVDTESSASYAYAPNTGRRELRMLEEKKFTEGPVVQVSLVPASAPLPVSGEEKFRSTLYGVLPASAQAPFSRMLYRMSRGNIFLRFFDCPESLLDYSTGELVSKVAFSVLVLGKQLRAKVEKISESFRANFYSVEEGMNFMKTVQDIDDELNEKGNVHQQTEAAIAAILQRLADADGSCPLRNWLAALAGERQICNIFMKAHYYLTMIAIEGWIPLEEVKNLKQTLKNAVAGSGNPPAAVEIEPAAPIAVPGAPPTYFPTDKFSECFQGIVETYGVPRYKEVNPGLFTIVTFPFLFGIMYGDIGHGTLLFIFALILVRNEQLIEKKLRRGELGEMVSMAFGGRYLLLLMSLFAIYCGFIYNDCFSIPFDIFGSSYTYNATTTQFIESSTVVYPFGLDPAWTHTTNQLAFYNSFKMKVSVLIGVTHMTFGIFLSMLNHIYFKDRVSVLLEFFPRIVFLLATFGYMDFIIVLKWFTSWQPSSLAPNLIQTMIGMFLLNPIDQPLYAGQAGFQGFLLACALIAVPVMLLGKPLYNYYRTKHAAQHGGAYAHSNGGSPKHDDDVSGISHGEHGSAVESVERVGLAAEHSSSRSQSDRDAERIRRDFESESKYEEHDENDDDTKTQMLTAQSTDSTDNVHNNSAPLDVTASAHSGENHSFSDEFIHNAIHTIEFVLGAVSNTASYLRLWALSLAHAELSEVFWDKMIMQYGLLSGSAVGAFIGFAVWFGATFAVLCCMDVLECFLHALRLHWVEFQSKFYSGDGKAFEPFTLKDTTQLFNQ